MTLSIAVMAMSNLPSIRLVSWKAEPGVGVTFTATLLRANRPFSSATQIGQLKPPGKTMKLYRLPWGLSRLRVRRCERSQQEQRRGDDACEHDGFLPFL